VPASEGKYALVFPDLTVTRLEALDGLSGQRRLQFRGELLHRGVDLDCRLVEASPLQPAHRVIGRPEERDGDDEDDDDPESAAGPGGLEVDVAAHSVVDLILDAARLEPRVNDLGDARR